MANFFFLITRTNGYRRKYEKASLKLWNQNGGDFEKLYHEIYPAKLEIKRENSPDTRNPFWFFTKLVKTKFS